MIVLQIVGGGKKEFLTFEGFEVAHHVVYHKVAVDDRLASAEDKLPPVQKREMFTEPIQLFSKGIGEFHGRRHYEKFVFFIQTPDHFLRGLFHPHGPEEILSKGEIVDFLMVVSGKSFHLLFEIQFPAQNPYPKFFLIDVNKLAG